MRVQVSVPSEIWEKLCDLAEKEYRTPRQQLGLIAMEALRHVLGQPQGGGAPGGVGEHEQETEPVDVATP